MAKQKHTDLTVELRKEQFFRNKSCAFCGSITMLELDLVNPLSWVHEEIWQWGDFAREKFIKNECQVLCSECYLRKKRLWKQYKLENADWYKEFLKSG